MSKRRWVLMWAAVLAVTVALGAGVVAQAQEAPVTASEPNDLGAAELGTEETETGPGFGLFSDPEAPGAALGERLRERREDMREGHRGGRGDIARRAMHVGGDAMQTVADALGMEVDELRDALRDGQTIADLAEERGVSLDDVLDAVLDEIKSRLDDLVADGTLTQERADEMLERAREHVTALLNGELGEHLRDHMRDRMAHRLGAMHDWLDVVADTLGMEVEDVLAGLMDGKTIADLAGERNVALEDVEAAILADVEARLQALVDDGTLTQEQADEMLERFAERIGEMLTSEHPLRGRGGCVGPGGPGRPGGPAPGPGGPGGRGGFESSGTEVDTTVSGDTI